MVDKVEIEQIEYILDQKLTGTYDIGIYKDDGEVPTDLGSNNDQVMIFPTSKDNNVDYEKIRTFAIEVKSTTKALLEALINRVLALDSMGIASTRYKGLDDTVADTYFPMRINIRLLPRIDAVDSFTALIEIEAIWLNT